jgi:hypothetical protein
MWSTVVAHKAPTVVSEGRQGIAEQRRGEQRWRKDEINPADRRVLFIIKGDHHSRSLRDSTYRLT